MIYNLRGTLTYCDQNFAVVECSGVEFKCFTTLTTLREIGKVGNEVNLYTHLSVREDAMDLFGFASKEELESFRLLISVSGIGPKAAVAILSEMTPDRLAVCIASGDAKMLTKAQGVGKKTAERVVLELKDKMGAIGASDVAAAAAAGSAEGTDSAEAVQALVALGYTQSDAAVVIGRLDPSLSVDEMIRIGLKELAKNL